MLALLAATEKYREGESFDREEEILTSVSADSVSEDNSIVSLLVGKYIKVEATFLPCNQTSYKYKETVTLVNLAYYTWVLYKK